MKPYEVIAATRGSDLSPTQRHLLTHMAMRAGVDGQCFASVATLCEDTGFTSERTVQAALRELVRLGVLRAHPAPGRSTTYTICADAIPRRRCTPPPQEMHPAGDAPPQEMHPTPAGDAPSPPQEMHPTPAANAPDPIRDPFHGSDPGGGRTRAREASPPPSPSGADRDGQQPAAAPSWAVGWPDIPPAEVVTDVCAVLAGLRGRPVRPAEAGREAALVRAALERTADSLPELQGQVELVIAWGLGSPDGQDELGGVRARTGERWGQDRTRLPSWVLGPRWPDWLDMARAWDSRGRVASSTGPPVRGEHPGRHAVPSAEDLEAMEQLRRELEGERSAGAAK